MAYKVLVGHKARHEVWTAERVLETDENGNPTKSVKLGVPVELTADEVKGLESEGFILEDSNASDAKEAERQAALNPGRDIAGAAPVFGDSVGVDQSASDDSARKGASGSESGNDNKK